MNRLNDFDTPLPTSGPRILHFTTWDDTCGIAGYARDLVGALDDRGVVNSIYPVNRAALRSLSFEGTKAWLNAFADQARGTKYGSVWNVTTLGVRSFCKRSSKPKKSSFGSGIRSSGPKNENSC